MNVLGTTLPAFTNFPSSTEAVAKDKQNEAPQKPRWRECMAERSYRICPKTSFQNVL